VPEVTFLVGGSIEETDIRKVLEVVLTVV